MNTLYEHISEITQGVVSSCSFKLPASVLLAIIAYLFGDNDRALGMLMVLITFDFLTAIAAKHYIGEVIESRKALKTVTKTVFYGMFVSAAHLTETIIPGDTFVSEMAISFLAVTELISIMENMAKMGYEMPQKLLNMLQDMRSKPIKKHK